MSGDQNAVPLGCLKLRSHLSNANCGSSRHIRMGRGGRQLGPGSLRPPWRVCRRRQEDSRGTRPSIWSSRPPAGGGLDDEDCDDEDSIHSHTSEEREGGAGGRGGGDLPSGRRTATTARLQSSIYLSLWSKTPLSQPDSDRAVTVRAHLTDLSISKQVELHTHAHSSINPLPPPSSPSSPSSPAPPAPSRCRPARGPERRPRAPAWCP